MCNIIIYLIENGLRVKPVWQEKVKKLRNKIFTIQFYFELLWVVYLDMAVALMLQVQVFEFNNYISEVLNYILMLLGLLVSFVPIISIYFLFKIKYPHFFLAFTENINYKYYLPIQYLRKLYFSLFICTFSFSPYTQVISLIIWNAFMIGLVLKTHPNVSRAYNIRDLISNILFLICTCLLLLFLQPQFSEEDTSMLIGWIVISVLGCMITIELGFFIKETITSIIEFLKKTKQKLASSTSVTKIAPFSPMSSKILKNNDQDINQFDESKPNILVRPNFDRPQKLNKFSSRNSNSTNDPIDKNDNSFQNTSPTKNLRPSPLSSQQNLKMDASINQIPSSFNFKGNSFLKPPLPQHSKKIIDSQSLEINSNIQERSQRIDNCENKDSFKDLQLSQRQLMNSPEPSKIRSLIMSSCSINDKFMNQFGVEQPSFIQSSEIIKQFIQPECQTDRKRSDLKFEKKKRKEFMKRNPDNSIQTIQQITQNLKNIENEQSI